MRKNIALVDDDRNILTTVSIALQTEGFARTSDQPPTPDLVARHQRHRRVQGGVGEAGQGAGDLVQVPDAAEVGQGGQQMMQMMVDREAARPGK